VIEVVAGMFDKVGGIADSLAGVSIGLRIGTNIVMERN
jgi:hypothetical protein